MSEGGGFISFDALRWLDAVGASFILLDPLGELIGSFAPQRLDDAALRRAQALAPSRGSGLAIARLLLVAKVEGHAAGLRLRGIGDVASLLSDHAQAIRMAPSISAALLHESQAASAYWSTWTTIAPDFIARDRPHVPEHWKTFGSRRSLLTESPRAATTPVNALLNYLFALLEAQAHVALRTYGLDPGIGVFHLDAPSRASFALDVMEAARVDVDTFVLDLLDGHRFRRKDFTEMPNGICRLAPALARDLARAFPRSQRLARAVEAVVAILAESSKGTPDDAASAVVSASVERNRRLRAPRKLPTLLTETNRSIGRTKRVVPKLIPNVCSTCGEPIAPDRMFCDPCLDDRRAQRIPDFIASGPQTLAALRASGEDPAHDDSARAKRSASQRLAVRARAAFVDDLGELDFARDILPKLAAIPVKTIVKAAGCSLRYAALIRRGERTPHRRFWKALHDLGLAP